MPVVALVWDRFHARNQALGRDLDGMACHVRSLPDGKVVLPLRYLLDGVQMWRLLNRHRPAALIVGTPPVFAALVGWWWCRRHECQLVVDSHTGAFRGWKWRWSLRVHRLLALAATAVLVHTEADEDLVRSWGASVILLPDELPDVDQARPVPRSDRPRVVVAGSLDSKEPVAATLEAARLLPDVDLLLTGDTRRLPAATLSRAPSNVVFTGWLDYGRFLGELLAANVVAVFSTDPRIMNRAAFEAIGMGRPLVLSNLPGLRARFGPAALFAPNEPQAMAEAIREAVLRQDELSELSVRLRPRLEAQHEQAVTRLKAMLGAGRP